MVGARWNPRGSAGREGGVTASLCFAQSAQGSAGGRKKEAHSCTIHVFTCINSFPQKAPLKAIEIYTV